MNSPKDQAYFEDVCARLPNGAEPVEPGRVFTGNWQPEPARCHENVAVWVRNRPEYCIVRGWLVRKQGAGAHLLVAHSVVSDQQGRLFDITPPIPDPARVDMRFLRHLGSEDEFWALLPRNNQRVLFCAVSER